MQLLHFSAKPLAVVRSVKQVSIPDHKPQGLWMSVGDGEDGWRAWCEAEQFASGCFEHVTEIILRPDADVLRLSGALEIDTFTREWAALKEYEKKADWKWGPSGIDWAGLAKKYDGILIAPYCYARRLDGAASRWYYSWDCASGCIWNADAIAELRAIRRQESEAA